MPAKGTVVADNTARRNRYIEYRIAGVLPTQAARLVDATNPRNYANDMERRQDVKDIVREAVEDARLSSKYTREGVLNVIDDAISMARMIADPATMIRGAAEVNKMQGYYAPEITEMVIEGDAKRALDQIRGLSESQLLKALGKEEAYIDATFEEIETDG